ncbi:MAG: fatty acid desaturase, partial [Albidovulum sp.]|uniref:fatty acid desaturase n=1 Tax=Albidovulum sp. TaxID=1872424 RepID=UPI003CC4AF77
MQSDIRDSFRAFPAFTQPFWTWVTGKPLDDEPPLIVPRPWLYLAVSLMIFASGVGLGIWVMLAPGVSNLWLLATLPATVYGARLLVLTISHQCAHQMFCHSKRLNQIVHDILTTLVCSQDYDSYRYDHFYVHHGIKTFGTFEDPVLSFIRRLGFCENMSKSRLWLQLIWTLVSPKFHGLYLLNRVRYNFLGGRPMRRVFAVLWWGSVVVLLWQV